MNDIIFFMMYLQRIVNYYVIFGIQCQKTYLDVNLYINTVVKKDIKLSDKNYNFLFL